MLYNLKKLKLKLSTTAGALG